MKTYEEHMKSGEYLLGQYYTALVKVINAREKDGTLPDGVKAELDAIGAIYDPTDPYNKEVADRLRALSAKVKVLPTTH